MVVPPSFVNSSQLHGSMVQVVPGKLYFASFTLPQRSDASARYINIDDKVHYDPFYTDFGPLNLSVLYRFCEYIHGIIQNNARKIVCYTNTVKQNRVNGAYLMGAYLIVYHNMTADMAYLRLESAQPPEFIGFRDAAMGEPTFLLHLHDVLRGVEKARQHKWLDFSKFDAVEYEYYERVENGDFNWIIPGKILSFCGPHNESRVEDGYPYHSPETYFEYFETHNITTIVRLNKRQYDAEKFTNAGFEHVDLFFIDGSTPSDEIVVRFINIVDKAKGGVAVHCKAGLGRTGTLIACWMMKEYGLSAVESMAWLRICRPGSVIGPQQQFLIDKQKFCWSMSKRNVVHRAPRHESHLPGSTFCKLADQVDEIRLSRQRQIPNRGDSSPSQTQRPPSLTMKANDCRNGNSVDEMALDKHGRTQGDRLLAMKVKSQHHVLVANNNGGKMAKQQSDEPEKKGRTPKNGNDENPVIPGTSNVNPLFATPMLNEVYNRGLLSSSRFSSPTTPIKPISPASSSPRPRGLANRSLASQLSTPPISKVTVAAAIAPVNGKVLPHGTKSSSSLRKSAASGIRSRPYPSTGARVELSANSGYALRSRTSPPTSSAQNGAKIAMPANTEALLGNRRRRRIS